MSKKFSNKTIHIAGSCSKEGDIKNILYAHSLVRMLTRKLLSEGANLVTTVDKIVTMNDNEIPIIFYWDILEEIYSYASSLSFSADTKNLAKVVSTYKSLNQIVSDLPSEKKTIWDELCSNDVVTVHLTPYGWNSGAIRRQLKESFSDALVVIGGGEGIEHLSHLYASHGKPVLPLNILVGSSCSDGRGGAEFLFKSFVSHPEKFIPTLTQKTRTKAMTLIYEKWKNDVDKFSKEIVDFLSEVVMPQVFFVRLMNKKQKSYTHVNKFFRYVVTPFVISKGYSIKEMGKTKNKEGFINVEIFNEINKSSYIVADFTGGRPNCFIEIGYSFGLNKKVILTAKKGTKNPLDTDQIPCYYWDPHNSYKKSIKELQQFWDQNIDRGPLVTLTDVI